MQENRSFDHYFGTLQGVRGFGDTRAIKLPNGKPVFISRSPRDVGYVLPFRPSAPNLGLQFLQDLRARLDQHARGMERRPLRSMGAVQGHHDDGLPHARRHSVPLPARRRLHDLRRVSLLDQWHRPTRTATTCGRGWVGNDGNGGGPVIDNCGSSATAGPRIRKCCRAPASRGRSIRTWAPGSTPSGSWGWTQNPYIGNYGDNSLLYFKQYRNAQPGSPLYDKARTGTNVANGDGYFDILKRDVQNNALPQVSWIVAPEAFSEHPNWPSNYGAWYVDQVLQILTSNPEVWSKTVLLINYDENDGFFDHMAPPFAPASSANGLSTVDTSNEIFAGSGSTRRVRTDSDRACRCSWSRRGRKAATCARNCSTIRR